jgi:hypothetical protein
VWGDYKDSGPGLQKHSLPAVTPHWLFFFENRVGLWGLYGIAFLEIDHGIGRVEKQGVV